MLMRTGGRLGEPGKDHVHRATGAEAGEGSGSGLPHSGGPCHKSPWLLPLSLLHSQVSLTARCTAPLAGP